MSLFEGDSVRIPLASTVPVSVSRDGLLALSREGEVLVVSGQRSGSTLLFVLFPTGAVVVPVDVAPRPATVDRKKAGRRREELDRSLRVLTGGVVDTGEVNASEMLSAGRSAFVGRASLTGRVAGVQYDVAATTSRAQATAMPDQSVSLVTGGLRHDHFWARSGLGTASDFSSAMRPGRSLTVGVKARGVSVEGTAVTPETGALFPVGLEESRLRLLVDVDRLNGVQAGSLFSLSGPEVRPLPFLGAWFGRWGFAGRLAVASSAGLDAAPTTAVSAQLSGAVGPCRLAASTLQSHAGAGAASYSAFVLPGLAIASAQGSCRLGPTTFEADVRRDGMVLARGLDLLASTGARWTLSDWEGQVKVTGGFDGLDLPRTARADANAFLLGESGKLGLQLSAQSQSLGLSWTAPVLSERLVLALRSEHLSLLASAGTVHVGASTPSLSALLVPSVRSRLFHASVIASAAARPGEWQRVQLNLFLQAGWTPARAWDVRVTAAVSPLSGKIDSVFGQVRWLFGDALPREPLLSPFRADAVTVQVWDDRDGDGVRDAGEGPLAGASVCVDTLPCRESGADGRVIFDDLEDGMHRVRIDSGRVAHAIPTTTTTHDVFTGRFARPRLEAGLRQVGVFELAGFLDVDDNHAWTPGEPAAAPFEVEVRGPDGVRRVSFDGLGRAELPFTELGDYVFTVDGATLQPGYLANGAAKATVKVADFRAHAVRIGVRALRSAAGRVCIDENLDGKCAAQEPGVGLVRVVAGAFEGATDVEGRFLLRNLTRGSFKVEIPELDVPGGLALRGAPSVQFGAWPKDAKGLDLPLRRQVVAKRPLEVLVSWPGLGSTLVRDLGGHLMQADGLLTKAAAPTAADAEALRKLGRLLTGETRLFVTLSPAADVGGAEADKQLKRLTDSFKAWLAERANVPAAKLVVDVAPARGAGPVIEVRAYRLVGALGR